MYERAQKTHSLIAVTVLLLFVHHAPKSHGYSTGAGSTACESSGLRPNHYGTQAQTGESTYVIELSANSYEADGSLTVTLKGLVAFKGFLVVALPEDDNTGSPIGSFAVKQDGSGTAVSKAHCTGGATHTSAFSGSVPSSDLIELTWTAPSTAQVNLVFYATFVKTRTEYWVKLSSATVYPVGAEPSSSTIAAPTSSSISTEGSSSSVPSSTALSNMPTSHPGSSSTSAPVGSSSTMDSSSGSPTVPPSMSTTQLEQHIEGTTSEANILRLQLMTALLDLVLLLMLI